MNSTFCQQLQQVSASLKKVTLLEDAKLCPGLHSSTREGEMLELEIEQLQSNWAFALYERDQITNKVFGITLNAAGDAVEIDQSAEVITLIDILGWMEAIISEGRSSNAA